MQKQIAISFENKITAAQVRTNVLRLRGVSQCRITGVVSVIVTYDEAQVQAKLIVKQACYLRTQRRPARILSVRELTPAENPVKNL